MENENDKALKRYSALRLIDFYGPLITEHRLEILKLCCEEDLSLSEIADEISSSGKKITRQAVHIAINEGLKQLQSFEDKLGLIKRHDMIISKAEECRKAINSGDTQKAKEILDSISEVTDGV